MSSYPDMRLRRLRRTPEIRALLDQPSPGPERFIWPVFVREGNGIAEPMDSMPGQYRYSVDRLLEAVAPVRDSGVNSVLVFGLPNLDEKDGCGTAAADPEGLVPRTIQALHERHPDLVVFTDVCLCPYTTHGHCGPLDEDGAVDNDAALDLLAETAVAHAMAGADGVAPSAMMDGQVTAIRDGLADSGCTDALLMSYSTKFASSLYGPFRDAEATEPRHGDRKGYQASYADVSQALRESGLDEAEGADILMVKPALFYLDVIHRVKSQSRLPLAAYNVSGEYAMHIAMAERGWGDLRDMVRESTQAIARAGADIIISYWANQYGEVIG